jgi:hypothetical protein
MSFTKVEFRGLNTPKKVSIRTYFDPAQENMGLEKYKISLHDGVYHTEQLACLEANGIKRYVTGLNEFAPEVKNLPEKEREAKVKEIRIVVAQLEKEFAANVIDVEDEMFWNKVELLAPNNADFWDKIELKAGNQTTYLDPSKNPYDLIKLYAIEAGGFSMVAKSLEDAQRMSKPPKFYLDKYEETISTRTASRKLKNKALAELQTLYDKNSNKLLYVTKMIDPGSPQYIKSTPNDVLYERMDDFINGNSFERNTEKAAELFLETARKTIKELKLGALIKDAVYYKVIVHKSDGHMYHQATQSMMGKNSSDIVEYLNNPMNDEILKQIMDVVEAEWNK